MKFLIILLFILINLFACNFGSLNHTQQSENEMVVKSPTSETDDCRKENYKHKAEADLAAMTPAQLIDEDVKELTYHTSAMSALSDSSDDYGLLIGKYIDKYESRILPALTTYINEYDPKAPPYCDDRAGIRFYVASGILNGLDSGVFRLRATKEGKLAIESLERGVKRMRGAGFAEVDHEFYSRFNISSFHVEMMKGTNVRDEMIRATLLARHKVQMTENEYLEFSTFLTSIDPTYPTWSKVGEYGPPTLLVDSKKYYEAYLKFKTKN